MLPIQAGARRVPLPVLDAGSLQLVVSPEGQPAAAQGAEELRPKLGK